jgi:UDP-N-acetylglucosamine 2-epimerase (non-hydrolysing)
MRETAPVIDVIAGARPNFVKIAPIIRELRGRREKGSSIQYRLIHTGQHYDDRMSGMFFEQLGIPAPDVNLEVGSGTHAQQTASVMVAYEQMLLKARSDLCLVVGDVNSTVACAIAAQKLNIKVAHVEAGIRSGDWTMPEEINRILTDSISNYCFTTSKTAGQNLRRSGIESDRIYFVGNTMIDTLLANIERFRVPSIWYKCALKPGAYLVITLHRPSNVDAPEMLNICLDVLCRNVRGAPVLFPVHPRTAKILSSLPQLPPNLIVMEPQPYLEFNYLVKHAKAVITDSGGITEEATVMGVPCMTLRDNTERPETVEEGTNVLIGTDVKALEAALHMLFDDKWKKGSIPEKWDGNASQRIVAVLEDVLLHHRPSDRRLPVSEAIQSVPSGYKWNARGPCPTIPTLI